MDLGKSLKIALAIRGINQTELAQLVGVSSKRISVWSCNGTISSANLRLISKALDMPVSEFIRLGES